MVKAAALLEWYAKYLGTREVGRNGGRTVNYFQSATGAYNAPWCVSFLQAGLRDMGVGRVADRTAGVFYLASWARRNGLTRSTPKRGYLVCFMTGAGHIGIVETVHHDGTYSTIEGNHDDRVARVRRSNFRNVFVKIPNVDYGDFIAPKPKPKPKWVPRFQIVSGEGPKTKVLVGWGKWANIQARIPRFVAQGRAIRLRRKLVRNP